ncbi:chitin synthase-domain-containing protein [Choanephora cucurbitarum]|nr:chitin synthase-domain-containing protein [Choanephora cucurbitarum]
MALRKFEISDQSQKTEDNITQVLKAAFQSNVFYSRISDSAVVAINPFKNIPAQSSHYIAQYKDAETDSTEPLPTHIYKLSNQAYLHMRRTGIDQSIIFNGESGSGKTESFKAVLDYLVQLSSVKKETKLQSQITSAQIILESFGNARTNLNTSASRFGKYMELQFNERGRVVGTKLLNYLLDKSRVIACPSNEQNFHVFYELLGGASAEEKQMLQLDDEISYRYISRYMAASGNEATQFNRLKQAMKALGINKKYRARIWQFLACLLHFGQLEFDHDPTIQEAPFVRNAETLDLCADFLGVDPQALENILTYRTQIVGKDVTTVILDTSGAAQQRDEIVKSLYSLLFSWLVEFINKKLCNNNVHNFIGILDLPGPRLHLANFDSFCINLANERLQNFCQYSIFEEDIEEYRTDGLAVIDVPYFNNQPCVELLTRSKHGISHIIDKHAKLSTSTDKNLLDAIIKHSNNHASFGIKQSETNQKLFSIQHFAGQVAYNPDGFLEANKDFLNADLVQLIRGNETTPASYNTFAVELFTNDTIHIESHPTFSNAIMNAQQSTGPLRVPSMRRTKSTKRKTNLEQDIIDEKKDGSKYKGVDKTVLSQLNKSLDELFDTLKETMPWFVFCIKPNDNAAPNQFDSQRVRTQVRAWGIPQICQRSETHYTSFMLHEEFLERYADVLSFENIDKSASVNEQCQSIISLSNWTTKEIALGDLKIFISETLWEELENKLRNIEKAEQRKQKDEKRVAENMASLSVPPVIGMERSQSSDTLSNASYGSNTDFLLSRNNQAQTDYTDRRQDVASTALNAGLPLPPGMAHSAYTDDQRSFLSDDDQKQSSYHDFESQYSSEAYGKNNALKDIVSKRTVEEVPLPEEDNHVSRVRRNWLNFVWFMTWWVPAPCLVMCGRMKRPDIQIAWREKFTLCLCIFLTSAFVIWFLVFFGVLICPHQDVFSVSELQSHSGSDDAYVSIRGEVFDLTKFAPHHWAAQVISASSILAYGGKDVSQLFPVQVSALCSGVTGTVSPYVSLDYNVNVTDSNSEYHNFLPYTGDSRPDWYFQQMTRLRKNYKLGTMGYTPKDIAHQAVNPVDLNGQKTIRRWAILKDNIYDLSTYVSGGRRLLLPEGVGAPSDANLDFLHNDVVLLFNQHSGQDITEKWNALNLDADVKYRQEVCLRNLFFAGTVDQRNSARCLFAEYFLLIVTAFLCSVIVFKFLAALQFNTWRDPEKHEKFVICQVPCYTEGEDELKKTIDSISALQYDDKRKLLFIICDGMIIGGGNDRPTPRIVLDILGVDPNIDPEALSFFSVGEGQKQHNMGKVYSGLYECRGHVVPYIVVSKVGKPTERQKPGNRGKRDSQLILMNFLNKVHFNSPMTPFELELYHQIKNVIGVNPSFYEYVLMVDADTEVMPDGLNRMVSVFAHDSRIIGLCGETVLSNEKDSWVTMIQVYEYFISHYLIKAFESLFGSVTCLPGCFCMYRIRSPQKNKPLLISNQIINDYAINKVDTLHKKNLLHLGEDRYLTTLILKHFPNYKTKFVPDAKCATVAPDQWSILLSQRRRWINSTIHNLGELVFLPQLCGFCCFSMRFIVMLDLFSTLVQPAIVGYLIYLIYTLATSTSGVPIMSILTIAGVYGLQALIFLLHRKWEHIIWMIVSIFAIPVFSFLIPIYSYWHFDDFSWGNTRVVMGDKGKKLVMADEGRFDPRTIPTMTWEEYERSMFEDEMNGEGAYFDDNASQGSRGTYRSGYTQGTYYSQQSYANRPGQYGQAASVDQSLMMRHPAPLSARSMSPAPNNSSFGYQQSVSGYTSVSSHRMNLQPSLTAGQYSQAQAPFR